MSSQVWITTVAEGITSTELMKFLRGHIKDETFNNNLTISVTPTYTNEDKRLLRSYASEKVQAQLTDLGAGEYKVAWGITLGYTNEPIDADEKGVLKDGHNDKGKA